MLPAIAWAQSGRPPCIGILGATTAAGFAGQWGAFKQGLRDLGWVEGRDCLIESRFADNQPERLPLRAAELVDLIVTYGLVAMSLASPSWRRNWPPSACNC